MSYTLADWKKDIEKKPLEERISYKISEMQGRKNAIVSYGLNRLGAEEEIINELSRNLDSEINWYNAMQTMIDLNIKKFIQLKAIYYQNL